MLAAPGVGLEERPGAVLKPSTAEALGGRELNFRKLSMQYVLVYFLAYGS